MYTCCCKEECFEKGNTLCTITLESRAASCKYCRYQKCLNLAGLVPKWVVSQYIPKVERRKKHLTTTSSREKVLNLLDFQVKTIFI